MNELSLMRNRKGACDFSACIVNQSILKMNSVTDEEMMEKRSFSKLFSTEQTILEMIQ